MGTAASPPTETADAPAKEENQPPAAAAAAAAAAAHLESAAPADPPAKEETQPAEATGGDAGETVVLDADAEAGEEEGECGFCLFMKGGGCKEEFVGWEKCAEEAEMAGGDVVERCHEATDALRKCMDAHAEYYEPILRTERAMAEDLEAMAASEASEASSTSPSPVVTEEEGDQKKAEEATSHASETSSTPRVAEEQGEEKKTDLAV